MPRVVMVVFLRVAMLLVVVQVPAAVMNMPAAVMHMVVQAVAVMRRAVHPVMDHRCAVREVQCSSLSEAGQDPRGTHDPPVTQNRPNPVMSVVGDQVVPDVLEVMQTLAPAVPNVAQVPKVQQPGVMHPLVSLVVVHVPVMLLVVVQVPFAVVPAMPARVVHLVFGVDLLQVPA